MKRRRTEPPFTARPVSLFGEAACAFAEANGFDVETYSLRGGRPLTVAAARAFLATGVERGSDFSSAIWIVLAFNLGDP